MLITNIRYGEKPVLKVYLGEKLVWQCVNVVGGDKSTSYTKAVILAPVLLPMNSAVVGQTYTTSTARALEITLMQGASENAAHGKALCDVLDLILMKGQSHDKSYFSANARLFNAIIAYSNAQSDSNISGVAETFDVALMKSIVEGESYTNCICLTPTSVSAYSHADSNSVVKAFIDCTMPETISGESTSPSYTEFVIRSIEAVLSNSDVNGYSDSIGSCLVMPILELNGSSVSTSYGAAETKMMPMLRVAGSGDSMSDVNGDCTIIPTIFINGASQNLSNTESNGNAAPAILSNSYSNSISNTNNMVILWYLPIEHEDALEIRQAYQIIIDEENGMMEVI